MQSANEKKWNKKSDPTPEMLRDESNGNMAQPYSLQASNNNSFRVINSMTPAVNYELNKDLPIEIAQEEKTKIEVLETEVTEQRRPHVLDTLAQSIKRVKPQSRSKSAKRISSSRKRNLGDIEYINTLFERDYRDQTASERKRQYIEDYKYTYGVESIKMQ